MPLPATACCPSRRLAQALPSRPWLLATALVAAFPVLAQTAAPASPAATAAKPAEGDVTSVVVTARRISERLQDVPVSVRALSGTDIVARNIGSLSELSQYTPGLSYSADFGRTQERPVIRGISALRPEAPQPVSVFIDGVYVRDGALGLAIDDVLRVEVIKGPQSALYGRSTYAGAINYVTVQPGEQVGGRGQVTIGGAGEKSVFAAITAPIKPDSLSFRLRAKHYAYGGQYTNELTGNKIGGERTNAIALNSLMTVSPDFNISAGIDYSEDRDGLFAAVARPVPIVANGVVTNQNGSTNLVNGSVCNGRTINIVGTNPATGLPDANIPGSATNKANGWPCGASVFSGTTVRRNEADLSNYTDPATGANYGNIAGLDRKVTRITLTLNYTLPGGTTLVSQTAMTQQYANLGADQSYNGTRFAPGFGAPASSWLTYDRDQLEYKSQEFRISSALDQPLTWLAGVFYYEEKTEGVTTGVIAQNAQFQTVADRLRPKSAGTTRNVAPFARVQYEFSKELRASLEGRYSREHVQVGGTPLGTAVVSAGTCVQGQVCSINGDRTFNDFAPRFSVDYKPSANFMVYGQLAKGSKSGGFNTTPGLASDVFAYQGEKITAFEVGFKSQPMPNVLFNLALFRNNVSELQLSNISAVVNPLTGASTTTTIVNNVGKARTQGLELEGTWRYEKWLTLTANYAYTDAKALEGTEVTNGTVFGGNRSVAGFTLPRSPKNSLAGAAAVELPVGGNGLKAFGRIDVTYQSRRYAEIQNMIWANAFSRVNLSGGVAGKGWRASLWVKNANNNDSSLNGFRYLDPGNFRRTAVDFLPRLRQVGATVNVDF